MPRDQGGAKGGSDGGAQPGEAESQDQMAPPEERCECFCLHCRRVFMSDKIWFQKVIGSRSGFPGFWMCPTPNCGGAGFTFDIFPTDPEHPANEGWFSDDDEEDDENEEDDEEEYGEDEEDSYCEADQPIDGTKPAPEYDPQEPHYSALDEFGDEDSLEGEEWKHGLAPGERPKVDPPPPGVEPRNYAEQEALYDAPDRRPREVDWSNRTDEVREEDIPF